MMNKLNSIVAVMALSIAPMVSVGTMYSDWIYSYEGNGEHVIASENDNGAVFAVVCDKYDVIFGVVDEDRYIVYSDVVVRFDYSGAIYEYDGDLNNDNDTVVWELSRSSTLSLLNKVKHRAVIEVEFDSDTSSPVYNNWSLTGSARAVEKLKSSCSYF